MYSGICAANKTKNPRRAEHLSDRLQIAILALSRGPSNHRIRCLSDDFYWTFDFAKGRRIGTHMQRLRPERLAEVGEIAWPTIEGSLIPFAAKPGSDTQFIIGEEIRTWDEGGVLQYGSPVTPEEFENWTKAALFLNPDHEKEVIPTNDGDLLMHPALRGYVYVDSFLWHGPDSSQSANWRYKFGYNLKPDGQGRFVVGTEEEARVVSRIWETVMRSNPEMTGQLSALLSSPAPCYTDALAVKRHASRGLASRLQQYLFQEPRDGKWYYRSGDMEKVSRIFYLVQPCPPPLFR